MMVSGADNFVKVLYENKSTNW